MKNISFLATFIIISFHGFSQGQTDNWYFGVFAGLNFSSSSPVAISDGQIYSSEGTASISDTAGNLLFYTDGVTIWNNQHTPMPNGTGLFGGLSSTQAALIAPQPGSDSIFYVFTTDEAGYSHGFCYSIVDLSLQSGLGDVTQKNIPILIPATEKLTGITTQDGSKTWIVVHEWGTNTFHSYALTSSGLNLTPVISNAGIIHNTSVIQNTYGQLKFSSCGERIAGAIAFQDTVEVFDFNIATGSIYNPVTIPVGDHPYGLEFSGTSSKLYITTYNIDSNKLLQYDLTAGTVSDIIASKTVLGTTPDLYGLQIASDGRIYCARAWNTYLGVVNFPDYGGTACDYVENGFNVDANFNGALSSLGLPNFLQSYFDESHKACLPTIVEEPKPEHDFLIYPNPTENLVYFRLKNSAGKPLHYSVFDITGTQRITAEVKNNSDQENKIDLQGMEEGVYLLKVETGNEIFVRKIFVMQLARFE